MNIRPFSVAIPDEAVADLRERLRRTRWPDQYDGAGWELGTEKGWLRQLVAYWSDGYDWRTCEGELNWLPQFIAPIDGLDVHFVHARSAAPGAMPLLITHGWPGSFVEMMKIAALLSDPERHGRGALDAFHVVAPSIPGYGFSTRPSKPGMSPKTVAGLWAKLMKGLGYDRFALQGGDLGSHISIWLARQFPEQVAGIHLNMLPPAMQPSKESLRRRPLSEREQKQAEDGARFRELEGAYSHLHRTKPQTPGYALNDSPAGLAAWMGEKFRAWADDLDASISRDELLTNISVYWFTQTITSSMRLYREAAATPLQFEDGERIVPPMAYADFPREVIRPARDWADRFFRVARWTEMPRGGHFAALEQPVLLADDVREFFRPLR